MQIKTFPYEFLARWRNGKLQGYHVITVDIACDDAGAILKKDPVDPASENLLERLGEATTLERAGVALDELLAQLHSGALLSMDAALAAETYARAAEVQATEERDSAMALVAGLQTQLSAASDELVDLKASLTVAREQLSLITAEVETLKAAQPAP